MATKYSNALLEAVGAKSEAEFDAKLAELLASNVSEIAALQTSLNTVTGTCSAIKVELAAANDKISVLQSNTAGILTSDQVKAIAAETAKTEASRVTADALGSTGNTPLAKAGTPAQTAAPTTFQEAVKAQPEFSTNKSAAIGKARAQFPDLYNAWLQAGGSAHF